MPGLQLHLVLDAPKMPTFSMLTNFWTEYAPKRPPKIDPKIDPGRPENFDNALRALFLKITKTITLSGLHLPTFLSPFRINLDSQTVLFGAPDTHVPGMDGRNLLFQ